MVDFQTFLQDVFMSEGLDLGKESQYLAYILCLKTEILFQCKFHPSFLAVDQALYATITIISLTWLIFFSVQNQMSTNH